MILECQYREAILGRLKTTWWSQSALQKHWYCKGFGERDSPQNIHSAWASNNGTLGSAIAAREKWFRHIWRCTVCCWKVFLSTTTFKQTSIWACAGLSLKPAWIFCVSHHVCAQLIDLQQPILNCQHQPCCFKELIMDKSNYAEGSACLAKTLCLKDFAKYLQAIQIPLIVIDGELMLII